MLDEALNFVDFEEGAYTCNHFKTLTSRCRTLLSYDEVFTYSREGTPIALCRCQVVLLLPIHQSRYQHVKDVFSTASKKFGLQISIIKTEVLFQSGTYHQEEILVDGKASPTTPVWWLHLPRQHYIQRRTHRLWADETNVKGQECILADYEPGYGIIIMSYKSEV